MSTTTPFTRPRTPHAPELRLFVLHHAGGSATTFFPLARALPQTWEPVLYDLPGHGRRRAEPLLGTVEEMVEHLVADLDGELDTPFALFGHSLGAVVAFETARALNELGRSPLWLGVSGRSAPESHNGGPLALDTVDDQALLSSLNAVGGGMPERIAEVPEFRDRFLRLARADLTAVDAYRPDTQRIPLPCPVGTFSGADDPWSPPPSAVAWEQETHAGCTHRTLPGGHFYFTEHGPGQLARSVATDARKAISVPVGRI